MQISHEIASNTRLSMYTVLGCLSVYISSFSLSMFGVFSVCV